MTIRAASPEPADSSEPVTRGASQYRSWWKYEAWALLLGHQGVRINAALHLRWRDVEDGQLIWRADWDKLGREWNQPIRDGTASAFLTAKQWRERDGYDGRWVFYRPRKGSRRHERADAPYTVQGFLDALRNAEDRAVA